MAKTPFDYDEFANKNFRHLENSITVQIIPSTYPLSWTTPRALLGSILKNKYFFPKTRHFIGHVSVELNCSVNGKKEQFFMGQSSASLDGFRNYLFQGYGFSILNIPKNKLPYPLLTVEGKLDNFVDSSRHFSELVESGVFGLVSFKVGEESCNSSLSFLKEYGLKTLMTKKAGNKYGFGADPRAFEGAGCAPFVQTVLEIAGLSEFAQSMDQTVFVPKALVGDPKKGNKVGLWDLLVSDDDMSQKQPQTVKFEFPDPQKLYDKVNKIYQENSKSEFKVIKKLKINNTVPFLLIDTTEIL